MTKRATDLLEGLGPDERTLVLHDANVAGARDISFRPHPRPGLTLGQMGPASRKAVFQLLSTAVSGHTFAQMTTIMGFEEVLDRNSSWSKHQHSSDYYFAIYGPPGGAAPWMWRLEGHHLSISVSVSADGVSATPLFLGVNPDNVVFRGRSVLRPLAAEDELGFALLSSLSPRQRAVALLSPDPPHDVQFFRDAPPDILAGAPASEMEDAAREVFTDLLNVYIGRFSDEIRDAFSGVLSHPQLRFAWVGGLASGEAHNYRIVAGHDLLIEYGNNYHGQAVANHSHTYIRRPSKDFIA